MVERHAETDVTTANENSLRSLGRSITFSQGQFSLVFACCNYAVLQEKIFQDLQEIYLKNYRIQKVFLPQNVRSIYTTIHLQLSEKEPSVLMVFGLESVDGVDELLRSINQIRDEFRKRHPFPMVLWVNDEILQKLVRLAPDFTSWAATPIRFEMTSESLLEFLEQQTDSLFATVLQPDTAQHQEYEKSDQYSNLEQLWKHNYELHYAIKELQIRGIYIKPELNASLKFVFGLDDYLGNQIKKALVSFQESLQLWQNLSNIQKQENNKNQIQFSFGSNLEVVNHHTSPELRQGVLLFYIGLCSCRLAETNHQENRPYWHSAKSYFQECLNVLLLAGRPDIVAQFINQLAEVLQHLQEWEELYTVAQKSLELHQTYGSQIQLASDYGFLAQVAVQQSRWLQASILAQVSLMKLAEARKHKKDSHRGLFPLLLTQIYQLILAKSQRNLGEQKVANEYLQKASQELSEALEKSDHRYDAHRYIRLLRNLRTLYFEERRYLEAYCIRQKRRSVEQQYGFRAFIGAGRLQPQRQATNPALMSYKGGSSVALEIAASGREGDINNLIGRISRFDRKLTVIHGQSGVGKSSTMTAGLVPALQNRAIGDQIAVPVVLQVYTDWVRELGKSLAQAIAYIKAGAVIEPEIPPFPTILNSVTQIIEQLEENANNQLITVLIFDQFEEFFFGDTDRNRKIEFDKFISKALNIPFVKVILSLREDYLHRLLEFKHLSDLEVINNNILDYNIRYQLNNLTPEYAKALIQRLTERSQFTLEPALIDALVQDLAAELGEVRPIELQVVGAQLQDERITKLAQYKPYRPNKLIKKYIQELINECGPENERAALLVLYLLTDENHKRPFKSRIQLATELSELEDSEKLELVLDILVRSGLVVLFPDDPERYQLIHDYLVDLIRYLQQEESSFQKQLDQLRNKVEKSQEEIARLNSELRQKKQQAKLINSHSPTGIDSLTELRELRKREEISQLEIEHLRGELKEKELKTELLKSQEKQRLTEARVNSYLKFALAASFLAIVGLTGGFLKTVNSEIKTLSASSQAMFASQKGIDALKESLKAGEKMRNAVWVEADTREKVQTALYQAVYGLRERNRLDGHDGHMAGVNSVSFSPDGSLIASASADNSIKLWHPDGKLVRTLPGHQAPVNSVAWSLDGRTIASASQDKTVKLWTSEGKLVNTLLGHTDVVNGVAWSRNNQIVASASTDKTVKLWTPDGRLLKTFSGHEDAVLGVAWSPDGKMIASASADNTIKLWNPDGKLLNTLKGHENAVLSVAWSSDSQTIASGALDQTIKLWNPQGKLRKTLSGHTGGVTSVTFKANSQIITNGNTDKPDKTEIIASSSTDETVKVWSSQQNKPLETLKGHNNWVNSVSFSPDANTLASASRDKTVKLWRTDDIWRKNPQNQSAGITNLAFNPQGDLIASAGEDKTVKLWRADGKLLQTLQGHSGQVWGVAWSPDGKIIASASKDKTVKLWSRDGKTPLKTLSGHDNEVLGVAWAPDGKIIASASKDKTVKLWSPEGKLFTTLLGHTDAVSSVAWSPDSTIIASASDDRTVKLWNRKGKLLRTLKKHDRSVFGVSWSPDSGTIASASIDGTVKLWSREGQLIRTLDGDGDWLSRLSFSPRGKILAAVSDDKVRLWNRDGNLLIILKGQKNEFTSLAFSPDGKTLATGSGNGTLIVRNLSDIKLENLLSKGCYLLKDYLNTKSKIDQTDGPFCPRN